jgi:hypothetical protein
MCANILKVSLQKHPDMLPSQTDDPCSTQGVHRICDHQEPCLNQQEKKWFLLFIFAISTQCNHPCSSPTTATMSCSFMHDHYHDPASLPTSYTLTPNHDHPPTVLPTPMPASILTMTVMTSQPTSSHHHQHHTPLPDNDHTSGASICFWCAALPPMPSASSAPSASAASIYLWHIPPPPPLTHTSKVTISIVTPKSGFGYVT